MVCDVFTLSVNDATGVDFTPDNPRSNFFALESVAAYCEAGPRRTSAAYACAVAPGQP